MAVKGKRYEALSPREAASSVGYGYSAIIMQLLGSLDQPIRNTDQFRQFYKQMLEEDESVGTGLEYLAGRVVSKIGEFSHDDPRVKELVDHCIESVRGTMTEIRKDILRNSFAFGFGVAEFTIKSEGGLWVLSSMPVYDPSTISFKMARFPDNSYGIGTVMQKSGMGQDIEIPAGKCLIKTHGNGNSPYGHSLLRRCYRWWAFKRAVPKLWAVALERYGMPLLHGKADAESTGRKLEEALANINSKAYIVTNNNSDVQAVGAPGGDISSGYLMADELCDKKIYRALFLPSLLGSGENGGSYSLGQVHLELFNATAVSLAEEYIDCELEQLWRPLIEWNFGSQESYGEFAITDSIPADEKKTLSEMLLNLANAGVVDPDSDREWMREVLGLPEPEEGAVFPKWELEQKPKGQESTPS
nr:MAG TPA: portal [Caudoviricetes sp.]